MVEFIELLRYYKDMKIYAVRHGKTDWNVRHISNSFTDIPLNEVGIRQAEKLRAKTKRMSFDFCYASPLSRAYRTAEIIVDNRCEIVKEPLLMERNLGKKEGKVYGAITDMDTWDWNLNTNRDEIEPVQDLLKRAQLFLDKIKKERKKDETVLIVSHGGFLRALHYAITGFDERTDLCAMHVKNCELKYYEI